MICFGMLCFFFFKQKTAYEMRISDWSSDVCSSDLRQGWRAINSTLGVARVVAAADAPIAVPEAVIERLRAREGKDGCVRLEPQRHLKNGDKEIGRASCRERVCQYV